MYSTGRHKFCWQLLLYGPQVCLCLLLQVFSFFPTSSSFLGIWGLKLSAWFLVPPQFWKQGYRQVSLSLLMFLLLWESWEAVDRNLHNSANSLTEKYVHCKSDMKRSNEGWGRGGCPEKGKGQFLSDKALGQGQVMSKHGADWSMWCSGECIHLGSALR